MRIVAACSGLLNGSSGKTHQDIEDFAIMRSMPSMTHLAPADAAEAEARHCSSHETPPEAGPDEEGGQLALYISYL